MSLPRKPIRIYESAANTSGLGFLKLVTVVSDYQSLRFDCMLYSYGDFEIVMSSNNLKAAELLVNRYVIVNEDANMTGIIKSVETRIGEEDASSEVLVVRGYEAKFILSQRLILPPSTADVYTQAGKIETAFKEVVKDCVGTDAVANRQFASFDIIATSARGADYTFLCRNVPMTVEFDKAAVSTGIGYKVYLDVADSKRKFDVIVGTDRSASVILSDKLGHIKSGTLVDDEVNKKTLVHVAGQGKGKNRVIRLVFDTSEPTGDDRIEALLDAREISATADLDAKGAEFLIENSASRSIELISSAQSGRVYNIDYFLGDTITLEGFGLSVEVIVTGASLCVDADKDEFVISISKDIPSSESVVANRINTQSRILQNAEVPPTLDNTWTPTLIGITAAGTQTYTDQTGYYFKIGKMVFFRFNVSISAKGAAMAGNVAIGGLPFTAATVAGTSTVGGAAVTRTVGITLQGGRTQLLLRVSSNSDFIRLEETGSAISSAANGVLVTNIAATSSIGGFGWYEASE